MKMQKIISVFLIMAMLFAVMPVFGSVMAYDGDIVGIPDKMYDGFPDPADLDKNIIYDDLNGRGNWKFQYSQANGNDYHDLDAFIFSPAFGDLPWQFTMRSSLTKVNGGDGYNFNWNFPIISHQRAWLNGVYDSVYTYTAPADGIIDISFPNGAKIYGNPSLDTNGVKLTVYKKTGGNYIAVGPTANGPGIYVPEITSAGSGYEKTYTIDPFTTAVKAGETLHFQIGKNVTVSGYNVMWDPCVTYTSLDYDASLDLGLTMNLIDIYAFAGTFGNYDKDSGYNGWLYQSYMGGTYANLTNYTENIWTIGQLWGGQPGISDGYINPGWQYGASVTYTASREGIVELPVNCILFADPPPPADHDPAAGVLIAIYQNETKIWPEDNNWFLAERGPNGYSFTALDKIALKNGDQLHFRAEIYANKPNHAGLRWDPHVKYLSYEYNEEYDMEIQASSGLKTTYDYTAQYGDKQGPIWYYLASPAGGVTYDQLEYVLPSWGGNGWSDKNVTFEMGFINAGEIHAGRSHDAVLAFKAPYTGKITLSGKSGDIKVRDSKNVTDGSTPGDGVDFGIFLRSAGNFTKLYPQGAGTPYSGMEFLNNGEIKTFTPLTIDIKKNEIIWIRVNNGPNGTNDHDSVNFQPVIEYLSINTQDPGVSDEDETGIERIDKIPGSSLKNGVFPVIARIFNDNSAQYINASAVLSGVESGTLAKGVYIINNNDTFVISDKKNKEYDFTGYKFIVDPLGGDYNPPSEKRFGLFIAACENVTVKNLTLEVRGTPNVVVHGWDCRNINLVNFELIDGYESGNLLSFEGSGAIQGDIIIDGLRFVSSREGKVNNLWLGQQIKNATVKNSYIKDATIECNTQNGTWIENNIIENSGKTAAALDSNGMAVYNTISTKGGGAGIYAGNKTNVLAALNVLKEGHSIDFNNVKNGVALLNELLVLSSNGGVNITVAENTFKTSDDSDANVYFTNVNYALGTNNKNLRLSAANSNNLSGENFTGYTLAAVGANENLLPKINKELFTGMERKTSVNYGSGNTAVLNNYIALKYNNSKFVIVPPGAYSTNPVNLSRYSDYTIYAYGVLGELGSYNSAVQMTDCENISIKGLYIDYTVPANGQAAITNVSSNTITFKMDPGYNQNLLDSSKYAISGGSSVNIQWYKQNAKIVSNVATLNITAVDAANGVFSIQRNNALSGAQAGDKLGFRGRDQQVTRFTRCSNMKLEDYTLFGGGGFGFMEYSGNESTILNRMAVIPGPAPVLSDGSRGPDRLMSTCDSTHSTNMRHGPQMTNCLFESATDDGTNINAEFGTVVSFDSSTRTITYTNGNNTYSGLCVDFKIGDRVLIYTKEGELLCDATAVSATAVNGSSRTVRINSGSFTIKPNITIIQNASASGNGFSIKNTRLYGNWTKGFLIKAIGGEISNCTFDSVGITAIYLCPEIRDGLWNECGYSENIMIKDNLIVNTGYMYNSDIYSTVINIRSDADTNNNKTNFMMMKNITITGNIIANRHTKYALNINGGNNILVQDNDWGYMNGKDAGSDTQTSAIITTSKDIELNNNKYPPLAIPKINISSVSAINIYGTDISAPIGNFVKGKLESSYNGGWSVVLTLENVSDKDQIGTVGFNYFTPGMLEDTSERTYSLPAGEKINIIYPVGNVPPELKSALFSIIYTLDGETVLSGLISEALYFNAAAKVSAAPVFAAEPDKIWNKSNEMKLARSANPETYNTSVRFLWDDGYLYLLAEVNDPDHLQQYSGSDIWNGDGIQFAIEPGRMIGAQGQLEIGFALNNKGTIEQWCWSNSVSGYTGDLTGKGFDAVIIRDNENEKTIYQIAMPWSFIGSNGNPPNENSITAFNVCVNNADTNVGRTYYELYGGIADNKNSSEFGLLCMYALNDPEIYGIIITGITTGNNQANINFNIKSANGKGYEVYISSTGKPDSFVKYTNVNYNSKGVHIKGLTNGNEYYAYIKYSDGTQNISRSPVIKFIPSK